MLIHLQDALDNGATTSLVRTVDTDVVAIFVGNFISCLSAILLQMYGLHLELESGLNIFMPMQYIMHQGNINPWPCLFFTPLLVAIQLLLFFEKAKSAWDARNSFPKVTDAFLFKDYRPHTLLSNENEHFKLLECTVLSCMTRQTIWNLSIWLEKRCFVKRIGQWNQFHQLRMHSCSIVNESSIKQVLRALVTWLMQGFQVHKILDGH